MRKPTFPTFLIAFLLVSSFAVAGITGMEEIKLVEDTIFNSDAGEVWLTEWSATDTDEIQGTVNKDEFEEETGEEPKQDFKLSMDGSEEQVVYDFLSSDYLQKIDKVGVVSEDGFADWENDEMMDWVYSNCYSFDGKIPYVGESYVTLTGYDWRVYCPDFEERLGDPYYVDSGDSEFSTTWDVEIGDKTDQIQVSNMRDVDSETSAMGEKERVYIDWEGSYSTGYTPPSESGILGVQDTDLSQNWKITDEGYYEDYHSYMSDTILDDLGRVRDGDWDESDFKNRQNPIAQDAVSWTSKDDLDRSDMSFDGTGSDAYMRLEDEDTAYIPNFQLFINADDLEIYRSVGKPNIYDVQDLTFDEPGGEVTVSVENEGDDKGSFEVDLECDEPVSRASSVWETTLDPGEKQSHDFSISGTSDAEKESVSGTCTATMTEETTFETDKATFDWEMKLSATVCEPDSYFIDPDNSKRVLKCNDAGTAYEEALVCGEDETPEAQNDGTYECVDEGKEGGGSGDGLFSWLQDKIPGFPDLTGLAGQVASAIFIGSLIVGGILSLLFGLKLGKKFENRKVSIFGTFSLLIIFLAVSFILGWVFSLIFTTGLILAVIGLIFL